MTKAPRSIFVIDDKPCNFDVIAPVLESEGYCLVYAPSAERALARLDSVNPDLLLLDIMMPGMSGIELCRTIRTMEKWKHIPIIMLTALTDKKDLANCLDVGADDFLSKPVDLHELTARVRSLLRIREQFEQIQTLLKVRDAMFHTIVHDLRNPLNTIMVTAEILQDNEGYLPLKSVESLGRNATKMMSLINDILVLGKLESTQMKVNCQPVDVNDLGHKVIEDAEMIAEQKQLTLVSNCQVTPAIAHIDFYLVRRTLDNLLMNAVKFSPTHSQIILTVSRPNPDQIQFEVADQGYGIPDDKKAIVFDPYQSGDDVSENVVKIGLGLTFCKSVAEAHGGSISVRDNQPQGCIFTLILPVSPS